MNEDFAIRFYRWAQGYADKEVDNDFPLVRQFEIAGVELFLRAMNLLDSRKKHLLARGMLGRFHVDAVASLNEPSNAEEVEIVEWYLKRGKRAFETGEWYRAKPLVGNRLPKREVRERLLAFVGDKLGKRYNSGTPGCVTFEASVQKAAIRTWILIGGRGADLAYHQDVWTSDGVRIYTGISALSWLGITGGPVDWGKIGDRNIDCALVALRIGCVEFLSAASSLVR